MSVLASTLVLQALGASLGARTEVRLRDGAATMQSAAQFDNVTQARLALDLHTMRASWELAYTPQWSVLSIGTFASSTLLVHHVDLSGQLLLTRKTTFGFSEAASYGQRNFSVLQISTPGLAGAGPAATTTPNAVQGTNSGTPQSLFANQTITFGDYATSATLSHELSARWRETTLASYSVSGGVDESSRLAYPRMTIVRLNESLSTRMSLRDTLDMSVDGNSTTLDISSFEALTIGGRWSRRLSTRTTSSLMLGASFSRWLPESGNATKQVLPVVAADISYVTHVDRGALTCSLTESVLPFVDRLLGTVYSQWVNAASISYTKRRVTVTGTANASINLGNVQRSAYYYANALGTVGYRLSRYFTLEGGVSESLFSINQAQPPTLLWATFAALSYSSGPLRL